jgi:hypothetical protein
METRNVNWNITPGLDGKVPDAQVTHALLIDIREIARSIDAAATSMRRMGIFFTVLAVIDCVGLFVWLVVR